MRKPIDISAGSMTMLRGFQLILPLLLLSICSLVAAGATLPPGFTESQFGGTVANMSLPTAMAFAPDGRLFICTQEGSLRVIKNGLLLETPFLAVAVDSSGERGLLGVAVDPNFALNQYVYIYYTTATAPIHNRVSRFTANGDVAVPGSEFVLVELNNLSTATNHNGGAIHFGEDGKLYIAAGENANPANAQSLNNLLGKILRVNPDGSIPADNPFYAQTTGNNRAIWALGLRNPFTFGFQPGTGRMLINDVGQVAWEETNDGIAGGNYGWPSCEGICSPPNPNYIDPIHSYSHDGTTCAIVGGAFYNPEGRNFPNQYEGKYFFADLCAGWIRMLDPGSNTVSAFASGVSTPVDLQIGPDGALYYLQRGNGGQVWRISFVNPGCDFDDDGKTDITVWRPEEGIWHTLSSGSPGSYATTYWGVSTDAPVPGDYDGDGRTDIAVWRPGTGVWYILPSGTPATYSSTLWGMAGDVPTPGDYDGDAKSDIAVWRPNNGIWYILPSSTPGTYSSTQWGLPADLPVPEKYSGDGKTDIAVWRPDTGAWYVLPGDSPGGSYTSAYWGLSTDTPVPGDYDSDGRTDVAVWRPDNGSWFSLLSNTPGSYTTTQWGLASDTPVPGDYDGDAKTDMAVWRSGIWYILPSNSPGTYLSVQWGISGDIPIASAFVSRAVNRSRHGSQTGVSRRQGSRRQGSDRR
jgi:glucose/arabinose dehydrogenase